MPPLDQTRNAPEPAVSQPAGDPVIRARGLVKRYGTRLAVDGIDFDVQPGECFGFLGPNGAGKSTLMRMLYGFTPMTGGDLSVLGMDVRRHPRKIKRRLGVVPQANNLDPDNTVWQNLLIYSRYFGIPAQQARRKAEEVLELFALADRRHASIDELSGGMQRRLVMARALLNDPEVVLLDEPTTGLDPQARRVVWRTLRRLLAQGYTMVLTTHYLDEAERLCDRLVMIDRGRVILQGRPRALIDQYVGSTVLEVEYEEAAPDAATFAAIDQRGLQHVFEEGVLTVYGVGLPEASAHEALASVPTPQAHRIVRNGTLEDVFLRATGHQLREDDA